MKAVASRNIDFVGHSDMDGRGDGVQVMVHRGHAYVGHGFSNGITVLDVRDLGKPKVVNFLPCPPNTRAIHLQTHQDLLLAVNGPSVWTMKMSEQDYYAGRGADRLREDSSTYASGLRVYDISRPAEPKEIGFMPVDGVGPTPHLVRGGALRLCFDWGLCRKVPKRPHSGRRFGWGMGNIRRIWTRLMPSRKLFPGALYAMPVSS